MFHPVGWMHFHNRISFINQKVISRIEKRTVSKEDLMAIILSMEYSLIVLTKNYRKKPDAQRICIFVGSTAKTKKML